MSTDYRALCLSIKAQIDSALAGEGTPAPPPPPPASGLPADFNEAAYLRLNPDVAIAVRKGIFPSGAAHYIEYGRREGRNYKDGTPPPPTPTPQPLHEGMNLTIASGNVNDLINRPDAAQRAETYCQEMAAAGYNKVRLVYDAAWGPQLLQNVIPALRAHGFKLLPILFQGGSGSDRNPETTIAWMRQGLSPIADLAIGLQPSNEQWVQAWEFPPTLYAAWFNAVAAEAKRLLPGLPILGGELSVHQNSRSFYWFDACLSAGLVLDVVSLHPYALSADGLRGYFRWVKQTFGSNRIPGVKYWVTETDLPPDAYLGIAASEGIVVEEQFRFAWNTLEDGGRYSQRPGGGILPR